ncbi:MAG: RIP metalloprotease RseP [Pseudomonadota bacterium]
MDLIPDLGGWPLTIVATIIALSVIVAVHEYGHYIVGRWSGIHAEVFSIGFGPTIFSRTDRRGTKWQLAAFPLGGYVKFLGDSSAASGQDVEAMAKMDDGTRRRTMHGAPLWARSATVAAGPVFNFVMSICVFAVFVLLSGQAVDEPRVGPLRDLPADMVLLQEGDVITAIEGTAVETLADVLVQGRELDGGPALTYTLERDGATLDVEASFPLIPVVDSVAAQSAAIDAGLEVGDVIRAIDGTPVFAFHELRDIVEGSNGEPLLLSVWREGEEIEITLSPRRMDLPTADGGFETRWLIGITGGLFFEPVTEPVGLWRAADYGLDQTWFIIRSSLSGAWHMITGRIDVCNLQGPIGIAETSGAAASQGIDDFIWFIAVLSTAVGLLNLFPIPILDGGHLVFHAYEAVVGKPPPERVLQVLMSIGLALLLTLMLFATFNDFTC